MVTFGLAAAVTAVLVDSAAGLVIVGVLASVTCAAIAANFAGFGQRAWVSSTWAASKRGLDLRLFRIFIGGGGAVLALACVISGLVLLLR
jgi:hypothetical protein